MNADPLSAGPQWRPRARPDAARASRRATAALRFDIDHRSRSCLARQYVEYPFHITRPHYLDDAWPEFATLCLQSVSGGLLQGDRVSMEIEMAPGTAAQVRSQASTKVHSMQRDHASNAVHLSLEPSSYLEYCPDAMILFPQARLHNALEISVAAGAHGVFWESFLYHDPAGSTEPLFERYLNEVVIAAQDGIARVIDRQRIESPHGESSRVLGEYPVQGSVYLLGERFTDDAERGLRDMIDHDTDAYAGVSELPGRLGCCMRVLARDSLALRRLQACVIALARATVAQPEATSRAQTVVRMFE